MTDETISIKIEDKVQSSVSTKIQAIATNARKAHGAVLNLKKELASLNVGAFDKLAVTSVRVQTEVTKAATATARLQATQNAAATAAQRLATEEQRTAKATSQAAAAATQAASATIRLENAQLAQAGAAERAKVKQDLLNQTINKTTANSKLARHHMLNLGFQLQDIGVSLASGQNPLVVFAQQGAQIQGIASQAGVGLGRLAVAAAGLLAPLLPLVAAIGAVFGGLKLLQSEANKTADIDAYAKSLGLTAKEMKKLEDTSVTLGDTLGGIFDTIMEDTGADKFFADLAKSALKAFKNILDYAQTALLSVLALFKATFAVIGELWARMPVSIKKPLADGLNSAVTLFENFTNLTLKGLNKVIEAVNVLADEKITPFENVSFGKISTDFAEASGKDLTQIFVETYTEGLKEMEKSADGFWKRAATNAADRAKERIKKQAGEIIADRTPDTSKQASEAEKLARALARVRAEVSPSDEALRRLANAQDVLNRSVKAGTIEQVEADAIMGKLRKKYEDQLFPIEALNRELQQELFLLELMPEARQQEARMLQIENKFRQDNIDLTKEQTQAIWDQLSAIQEAEKVARVREELQSGSRAAYQDDRQLRIKTAVEEVGTNGFTKDDAIGALAQDNVGLQNTQQYAEMQLQAYRDMYAEIDILRQADMLSEGDAMRAKFAIFAEQATQYANVASGILGDLASLRDSDNKKAASIAKKAGVLQATINAYSSAVAAYQSAANIPYVGWVLGPVAAGAALAAGMANVGKIRAQNAGFMTGGYTGNIPTTEVAGAVHGKEYVFDAAATSRIGVANLESLRKGAASLDQGGSSSSSKSKGGAANDVNYTQVVNVTVAGKRDRRTADQEARAIRKESTREFVRSGG